jgi:hypothetical protein
MLLTRMASHGITLEDAENYLLDSYEKNPMPGRSVSHMQGLIRQCVKELRQFFAGHDFFDGDGGFAFYWACRDELMKRWRKVKANARKRQVKLHELMKEQRRRLERPIAEMFE